MWAGRPSGPRTLRAAAERALWKKERHPAKLQAATRPGRFHYE
jgi:hypothetical protein